MNNSTVMTSVRFAGLLLCAVTLAGCGGDGSGGTSSGPPLSPAPPGPLTNAQRTDAAAATAQNNAACTAIQPFYWETGDRTGALASGSVGATAPTSASNMLVASASKWLYGAYVLERRLGVLTNDDISALTMRYGYTHFRYGSCIRANETLQDALTVFQCLTAPHVPDDGYENDDFELAQVGRFFYNGGHYQIHAM